MTQHAAQNLESAGSHGQRPGRYLITTVNGTVYEVLVPSIPGRPVTLQRNLDGAPRSSDHGLEAKPLYSDGAPIVLLNWAARVGNHGAIFQFITIREEDAGDEPRCAGTNRWTSPVVSILFTAAEEQPTEPEDEVDPELTQPL